mgnify:CR=1 FL=1
MTAMSITILIECMIPENIPETIIPEDLMIGQVVITDQIMQRSTDIQAMTEQLMSNLSVHIGKDTQDISANSIASS